MDENAVDRSQVWHGLVLGFVLHMCQVLFLVLGPVGFALILGIGVSQFLYLGPLMWHFYHRGSKNAVKGLVVAAGITFLLNATCWGLVGVNGVGNLGR